MNKEKVLILGSDGMAGHMLVQYLEEKEYNVYKTTLDKERKDDKIYYNIVIDYKSIESIISSIQPDFVVNCIGILNKMAEENPSSAVLINSFFPHYIDDLSKKYGFKFIHMSTDCVFSGKKGSYLESDIPDETSLYGRSKALGEIDNTRNLTLRTSIIGPDINEYGIGLFHWFMKQKGEVRGFDQVMWSGVTTLEFARSVEKTFHKNISGLYHLVNNEKISKYNLLILFQKYMNKEIIIHKESETWSDKSILNTRKDFYFQTPSYEKMIEEMSEWIKVHKDLYPFYSLQ